MNAISGCLGIEYLNNNLKGINIFDGSFYSYSFSFSSFSLPISVPSTSKSSTYSGWKSKNYNNVGKWCFWWPY